MQTHTTTLAAAPSIAPAAAPRPAPLWIVLAASFLNSVGTGIVTSGIYYLTKQGYGFSQTMNYVLGLVIGATYIGGSLGAQPALAWLRRRLPGLSTRGVLVGLMVVMGGLCALPIFAGKLDGPNGAGGFTVGVASIWVMVAVYSPLSGVLWPIIESYLSGARRGEPLRRAIGVWNVTWSAALVAASWAVAPAIKDYAAETILVLGGVHLLCVPFFRLLSHEPAAHEEEHHEPHPPVYAALLVTFRMLLPVIYLISSALGPYLPMALTDLGVPVLWHTVLGSAWLLPRAIAFFVLMRWQGWHGRWSTAIISGLLVIVGFGVAVMAPTLPRAGASHAVAVAVMVTGLAVFGLGMAVVYMAALYYGLAVGKSEVQAGGKHEALIGCGYTLGPACGLAATAAVNSGLLGPNWFNAAVLGTVGFLTLGVALAVVRRVRRMSGPGWIPRRAA